MKIRRYVMAATATALLAPMAALSAGAAPALTDVVATEPSFTFVLDPFATALRDGTLRVSGSYSCLAPDSPVNMIVGNVTQIVGRTKISGGFATEEITCDGVVHPFAAVAVGDGLFAGGKVTVDTAIWTCTETECSGTDIHQELQVKRGN